MRDPDSILLETFLTVAETQKEAKSKRSRNRARFLVKKSRNEVETVRGFDEAESKRSRNRARFWGKKSRNEVETVRGFDEAES